MGDMNCLYKQLTEHDVCLAVKSPSNCKSVSLTSSLDKSQQNPGGPDPDNVHTCFGLTVLTVNRTNSQGQGYYLAETLQKSQAGYSSPGYINLDGRTQPEQKYCVQFVSMLLAACSECISCQAWHLVALDRKCSGNILFLFEWNRIALTLTLL